jgi:hypothetical protein
MNTSQHGERASVANNLLEPLINEHECSLITGRSVASLRRDRLLGVGIPHVKLTSLVRYDPRDTDENAERHDQNQRGFDHGLSALAGALK